MAPARQKADRGRINAGARLFVEQAMTGGQHQIGFDQNAGAKGPSAQIQPAHARPAAAVIAGFKRGQAFSLRHDGQKGDQGGGDPAHGGSLVVSNR